MRVPTEIADDLRERPTDAERLEEALEAERDDRERLEQTLRTSPNELDRTRLGRVLHRLGEHLRLAGAYEEAARCCDEAIDIWEEFGRDRAAYLARLRRAEVDFDRGDLEHAHEQLDTLVDEAAEEPFAIYRDFALELRGRIRLIAGRTAAGREDLRHALQLRKDRKRERLVGRTERILEIAERGA